MTQQDTHRPSPNPGNDHRPGELNWRTLSASRAKWELFGQEPHLTVGIAAAEAALGPTYPATLQRLALLVVQPDVIAQRRVERCLDYLREHSFTPVAMVPFVLEAEMTAEVWRYQVNTATQDSRDVCDLFCAKTESLLLVVADRTPRQTLPASLRMTTLKGASAPQERTERQLRTFLGATNRIVSAVHCSDEPADLLREPPIMIPGRVKELYQAVAEVLDHGQEPDLAGQIAAVYERVPPHDIDVPRAAARLAGQLPLDAAGERGQRAARLRADLDVWLARERFLSWPYFSGELAYFGIDPHCWDALLVASEFLDYDRTGVSRILAGSGYEEWAAGEGVLLV